MQWAKSPRIVWNPPGFPPYKSRGWKHDRFAGWSSRGFIAQCFAVNRLLRSYLARHLPGMAGVQRLDHGFREPRGVTDQRRRDGRLYPIELVVQRRRRHPEVLFVRLIRRMDGGLHPEDDFAHELHQRGEQSFAGILLRGGAFEEGINPVGVQQALSHAPGHDTDETCLHERGKYRVEQPRCPLQAGTISGYTRQQCTKYG